MFERFKASLFQPNKIKYYQDDPKWITTIYFLLLVLITIIPSLILIFTADGLGYYDKRIIRDVFRNEEIPYQIVDNQLVKTIPSNEDYFEVHMNDNLLIVFTEEESFPSDSSIFTTSIKIVFTKYNVYYSQSLLQMELLKYQDYEYLKNLDFSGAYQDNPDFWNNIFPIINDKLEMFATGTMISNVIIIILATIISMIIFSLMIAFFQKPRFLGEVKYSKLWKLSIYLLTPYILISLFGELYSLPILSLVGGFVTIIYANIMSRSLVKS